MLNLWGLLCPRDLPTHAAAINQSDVETDNEIRVVTVPTN